MRKEHFAGLALAGGKTDKACVAVLEYFPEPNKIFLSQIYDGHKPTGDISGDLQIVEALEAYPHGVKALAVNAPLSFPKCIRCKLKCPGYEVCTEDEIQWMWNHWRSSTRKKNKRAKLFTPYTERAAEQWLSTELEEKFEIQHAMGANMAPLMARAQFLSRRLKMSIYEANSKVSLWRIGRALSVQKSYLRFHTHAVGGEDARTNVLTSLVKKDVAFLYEQDIRLMVKKPHAFDAFVLALTALLKSKGQCENRPKGFPKEESWIELPKRDIIW